MFGRSLTAIKDTRRFSWTRPGRPGSTLPANAAYQDARADPADRSWVDVGGLADLRANRLVAEVDGISVLVVRAGRTLAAVENECPHLGHRLSDGQVSGRVIRCVAHGHRWDLVTGRPVQALLVPRRPLREFPVRLAGDRILLARPAGPGPADDAGHEAGETGR